MAKEPIEGFVVGLGRTWILLKQIYDFWDDGYVALRKKDISSARFGRVERFHMKIIKEELEIGREDLAAPISFGTTYQMFRDLAAANAILRIESEYLGWIEIGRIKKVSSTAVFLQSVDVMGVWSRKGKWLPYREISIIGFDENYSNVLANHARSHSK